MIIYYLHKHRNETTPHCSHFPLNKNKYNEECSSGFSLQILTKFHQFHYLSLLRRRAESQNKFFKIMTIIYNIKRETFDYKIKYH